RHPAEIGRIADLLRGIDVEVDLRELLAEEPNDLDIILDLEIGRETGLDADLGRPISDGFLSAPEDLFFGKEVALLGSNPASERAEAAGLHAKICEVDVAVDDVAHLIAGLSSPEHVGDEKKREELAAGHLKKERRILGVELLALEARFKDARNGRLKAGKDRPETHRSILALGALVGTSVRARESSRTLAMPRSRRIASSVARSSAGAS